MLSCINQINGGELYNGWCSIIDMRECINFEDRKYIVYEYCRFRDLSYFLKLNRHGVVRITHKHVFMIAYQIASVFELLHYRLLTSS
jgi:serine/threonine protein kinase